MTLVKEILRITARRYPLRYKELYERLYNEKTSQEKKLSKGSLYTTLSRMKANGLLKSTEEKWTITPEGEEFLDVQRPDIRKFFPPKKGKARNVSRNLIIVFDIPEKKRRYRDWLRSELIGFDFEQIQKSVWFGPSLPEEFVRYLEEENLLEHVRFFRATEKDLI